MTTLDTRTRRPLSLLAAGLLSIALGASGLTSAASADDSESPVSTEVGFGQVAAGATHGVAVGKDGKAYSWGYNIQGRLGDGTGESRLSPVAVDSADLEFTQVSAALSHSLALTTDGRAYAWGAGAQGKLGDGAVVDRLSPVRVQIPETETITAVEAGKYHSLALTQSGDIYAWGAGSQGQLGNNAKLDVSVPVKAQRPEGVKFVQVSAGEQNSSAIGDNGVVYSWGYNNRGQLGTGNTTAVSVPTPVTFPTGVKIVEVAAGEGHTVATADDGAVYAWGYNNNGQLGNGGTANSSVPVLVSAPDGVEFTSVDAGRYFSVATSKDGRAFAWGTNRLGHLGNGQGGTGVISPVPVEVSTPQGVHFTQIAAGANHATAVSGDGKAYSWGSNIEGYLGDGTSTDSLVPVAVVLPLAFAPSGTPDLLSADVNGTSVAVQWSGIEADGYSVRLRPESGADLLHEAGADETSAVISSLTPGATYAVSVAGTNWVGIGRYSTPETITIPAIATSVAATAKTVAYGQKGALDVRISPDSATGTVGVRVGSATYSAKVEGGRAKIVLPARVQRVGRHSAEVTFTSVDLKYATSKARVSYNVAKATSRLKVTTNRSQIKRGSGLRVSVRVNASGLNPTGRVKVVVAGTSRTVTVKNGKATAVFAKLRQTGAAKKVVVRYLGSNTVKPAVDRSRTVSIKK